MPLPYVEALSRLQDDIEQVPFERIEEIVTSELGVRLSKAFTEFDAVPLAGIAKARAPFCSR